MAAEEPQTLEHSLADFQISEDPTLEPQTLEHSLLEPQTLEHPTLEQPITKSCLFDFEIDISIYSIRKLLISKIEYNMGNMPEIIRFYDLFETINDLIKLNGYKLGQPTALRLQTEINQLKEIFSFDTTELIKIICLNDKKQYKAYYKKYTKRQETATLLQKLFTDILHYLKIDNFKINQRQTPRNTNDFYIRRLKTINILINELRLKHTILDFIINTNKSSKMYDCVDKSSKLTKKDKREYQCAASIFDLPQDEFLDLTSEDTDIDDKIFLHSSRFYKCWLPRKGIDISMKTCLQDSFVRINNLGERIFVELFTKCPCKKIKGTQCIKEINLDILVKKYSLDEFETVLTETKQYKIFELYGMKYLINCPNGRCPNAIGFTNKNIANIGKGTVSIEVSPLYKCELCSAVWCSNCNKSHPGRICHEVEDEKLDPNIKRCPKCKILTLKDEGCFHMNCTRCNVHWCWNCNQFTDQSNAYAHRCIVGNWMNAS